MLTDKIAACCNICNMANVAIYSMGFLVVTNIVDIFAILAILIMIVMIDKDKDKDDIVEVALMLVPPWDESRTPPAGSPSVHTKPPSSLR